MNVRDNIFDIFVLFMAKGIVLNKKIPVLKTHVAYWLPQHSDVLAFSSAQSRDGGTGALYVLLKSHK